MHTLGHAITAAFSSYFHKLRDKQAASGYMFNRYVFEANITCIRQSPATRSDHAAQHTNWSPDPY